MRHKDGSRIGSLALTFVFALSLSACGGGGGSGDGGGSTPPPGGNNPPLTFRVGATVSGLRGAGLVLGNGTQDLTVAADGNAFFTGSLANGTPYSLTVRSQPSAPSQTCALANATGSINSADALAQVTCTTNSYSLQGSVTGLLGSGLRVGNGAQSVELLKDGDFSLGSALSGSDYAVTVSAQPIAPSQTCEVDNGSGSVGASAIANIRVRCTTNRFALRGTVAGLASAGLVLQSNSGESISIDANGAFAFPTSLASGTPYAVSIAGVPAIPAQTCQIGGAVSGVIQNSDVALTVDCSVNRYRVLVRITGLTGTGLELRLNGAHPLVLDSNGLFAFDTPISSGSAFNLSVQTQPGGSSPPQTCTLGMLGATITNYDFEISVTCVERTYAIRANVTGLVGSGLALRSQPGGDVAITSNGTFTFPYTLTSGTSYSISTAFPARAPVQTCVIDDDTGVVGTTDISVDVECTTDRFVYLVNQVMDRIEAFTINSHNGSLLPLSVGAITLTGDAPANVVIDPTGTFLYVTNSAANTVSGYRIDAVTGALSALPGSPWATGAQPVGIGIDPTGHFVYVANYNASSVSGFAINAASGSLTPISSSPFATDPHPLSFAMHPGVPYLYLLSWGSTSGNESIRHYSVQGNGALSPLPGLTSPGLLPYSMVFEPSGQRIYSTDASSRMYVFDVHPDGSLSTSQYSIPIPAERIVLHPSARLAFTANHGPMDKNLSVYSLDATTGQPTVVSGSPYLTGNEPTALAVHPDGKFVFVTDIASAGVHGFRIDLANGVLTAVPGSPFVQGASIHAIAIR